MDKSHVERMMDKYEPKDEKLSQCYKMLALAVAMAGQRLNLPIEDVCSRLDYIASLGSFSFDYTKLPEKSDDIVGMAIDGIVQITMDNAELPFDEIKPLLSALSSMFKESFAEVTQQPQSYYFN